MALDELHVHIFGGGARGESIVLQLPTQEKTWGVVDSYSPSLRKADAHPVVRFLNERKVKTLEFVALTHPHSDHYRGMSTLLQHFKVMNFWRFDGITPAHIAHIVSLARGEKDEAATELEKIFRLRQEKDIDSRTMSEGAHLYPWPKRRDFSIRSVAPTGRDKDTYETSIKACFGADGSFDPNSGFKLNHNLISSALVIELSTVRVVLGGDVEENGWKIILQREGADQLTADLVKVAHHGSTNGYCDGLWEAFGKRRCTAAVTTYAPKGLPDPTALTHIKKFSAAVYHAATVPVDNTVFEGLTLEEQEILRRTFVSVQPSTKYQPGICSFVVNVDGVKAIKCEGAAGRL